MVAEPRVLGVRSAGKGFERMIRKLGRSWLGALLLASTLLATPVAWAAGPSSHDAETFWTSIDTWFQSLLSDWFGPGTGNPSPESTYDEAKDSTTPKAPERPEQVGPGDVNTTDDGSHTDPNGG